VKKITVSLAGGLGNQLFQYAFALSLIEKFKVTLELKAGPALRDSEGVVEILAYELDSRISIENKFDSGNCTKHVLQILRSLSSTTKMSKNSIFGPPIILLGSLYLSFINRKIVIPTVAKGTGYFNWIKALKFGNYFVGFFHSSRWCDLPNTNMILKELKLVNKSDIVSYFQKLSELEKPLVVHIRLGDYVDNPKFGIPSPQYYLRGIQQLWKSGSYKKIWVFTNDQRAAEKIFPSEFLAHTRWIPEIEGSASKTLEVMRFGKGYLIGNSTFSWWGARLSYENEPEVIVPKPWFAQAEVPLDLIPPKWKELSAGY
jgi:hypothetical protein